MATAELQITRVADGWRDRTRKYKIYVNGERRDDISRGETKALEVEAGEVEVFLKIDWCRSRKLELDLEAGSKACLGCGPRGAATGLYGITLGFRDYMWLRREDPAAESLEASEAN